MRQERARRLLESKKDDDFRTGCGVLPDGLRDRVRALEAVAVTGANLYGQRKVEAVRGPWLQEPGRAAVVAKPSKNKARKKRAPLLKELERGREAAVTRRGAECWFETSGVRRTRRGGPGGRGSQSEGPHIRCWLPTMGHQRSGRRWKTSRGCGVIVRARRTRDLLGVVRL